MAGVARSSCSNVRRGFAFHRAIIVTDGALSFHNALRSRVIEIDRRPTGWQMAVVACNRGCYVICGFPGCSTTALVA